MTMILHISLIISDYWQNNGKEKMDADYVIVSHLGLRMTQPFLPVVDSLNIKRTV